MGNWHGCQTSEKAAEKMLVMGFKFVLGVVRAVMGSVHALNVGLYVLLKALLMGMTLLGSLMGVAPDRVARDVMLLEGVGHVLLLSILVRSSALILREMGHFLHRETGSLWHCFLNAFPS